MKKNILLLMLITLSFNVFSQSKLVLEKDGKKTLDFGKVELKNVEIKGLPDAKTGKGSFYLDSKNGVSTIYGDGKSLVTYAGVKVDSLLNKGGRFLDKSSLVVWETLVMQQRIKSVAILFSILTYLSLIVFYKSNLKKYNLAKEHKYDHYTTHQTVFIWGGLIILVALGVFNVCHFTTMLTGFMNPRWGALKDIVEAGGLLLKK